MRRGGPSFLILLLLPLAHAQEWRLTRSQSLTQEGATAWRYTLSPAGKEARELWQRLALQYQDHLRAGYRVDLGSWRLYFLGGRLRLEPHCPKVNPACLTFGALPVEKTVQDRFLLELSGLLDQALAQARATRGTLTLSQLFRVEVKRGQTPPYPARPSGWAP
ncbi:FHA domain-containing protein [Thermus brockianus]